MQRRLTDSLFFEFNLKLLYVNIFTTALFLFINRDGNLWVLLGEHAIVAILIQVAAYFLLKRVILTPLERMRNTVRDLAEGEGDVTKRLNMKGHDEISEVARYMDAFIEKIQLSVNTSKTSANGTLNASRELQNTAGTMAQSFKRQSDLTETSNQLVTEIGRELDKSEEAAISTAQDLDQTAQSMEAMVKTLSKIVGSINNASQTQTELADRLTGLNHDAEQVKTVLGVISDIADQTNLLALNAAIEAARAGEHGRGFAVVADEVRNLADRTQKALGEINATINTVVQAIGDSTDFMNQSAKQMNAIAGEADRVQSLTNDTRAKMTGTMRIAHDSSNLATAIAYKTKTLVANMGEVMQVSNANRASLDQVTKIAGELGSLAGELNARMNKFKS
ncbi:MAG: methyl-accepting chemotaxis protein [Campylobacterales bacterium]